MGFTFEQHLMEIDHTKEDKIVLDITPKIEKKLIEKKKKCA